MTTTSTQAQQQRIPFPTYTVLPTVTVQLRNVLPLNFKLDPLEFPENNTETQPPPATAFRDALNCCDSVGTDACALFPVIVHPPIATFDISKAAMAPPHVEHGCVGSAGQLAKPPPLAELAVKMLFWTLRTW